MEAPGRAPFDPAQYAVQLASAVMLSRRGIAVPVSGWVATPAMHYTPESLNAHLKRDWHKEHVGSVVFHDEESFADHVIALLTKAA